MEFSYRDKHYLRNALKLYLSHLKSFNEDDEDISEDEFSEIQDDIMLVTDLLYEIEKDLEQLKKDAPGGTKLYSID